MLPGVPPLPQNSNVPEGSTGRLMRFNQFTAEHCTILIYAYIFSAFRPPTKNCLCEEMNCFFVFFAHFIQIIVVINGWL